MYIPVQRASSPLFVKPLIGYCIAISHRVSTFKECNGHVIGRVALQNNRHIDANRGLPASTTCPTISCAWVAGYTAAGAEVLPSGTESLWSTVAGHYAPTPATSSPGSGPYAVFFEPLRAGTAVLYAAVFAKCTSPRLLACAVPVLMFFSLAWEVVVDFRFATSCWEGYHFWIPVVQYLWYIQYTIFPL